MVHWLLKYLHPRFLPQNAHVSAVVKLVGSLLEVTVGQVEAIQLSDVVHEDVLVLEIVAEVQYSYVFIISAGDYYVVQLDVLHSPYRVHARKGKNASYGILEFREFEGVQGKLTEVA